MIVSVSVKGKSLSLEGSKLKPPTVGEFMTGVFNRRALSREHVARRTGMNVEEIDSLLNGTAELDRSTRKKLDKFFPGIGKMLLRLEKHRAFYERYGSMRPNSPVRRAFIKYRNRPRP